MPGQTSRVSSSHRNKEKYLLNICGKLLQFQCNCKITVNSRRLNNVMFYLKLTYHIYNTRYQFNDSRFLTKYQVTTRNRCSKWPPPGLDVSMCDNAHMDTSNHELSHIFKGPETATNGSTVSNTYVFVKCLFISKST